MKIKEIGGEFALIERFKSLIHGKNAHLLKGIGDDAAVIQIAPEPAPLLLVTTDILVENRHFRRDWATPHQIGFKAVECNVSDIAAMGGTAHWMFVSIVLPSDIEVDYVEHIYLGMNQSCQIHNISLAGGDTTQGEVLTINITLLGSVTKAHVCMRSHAKPGDRLMVSGFLGASAAALALLHRGYTPSEYLLKKHLTPVSRMDVSSRIAPLANAMIDISDGLGSEVHHICEQSQVGAIINAAAIPVHPEVLNAARQLNVDPLQLALSGGEDFELLFSISPDKLSLLKKSKTEYYEVGQITDKTGDITLSSKHGKSLPLPSGYNHFQ